MAKNYDREEIYTDVIQEFEYLDGMCITEDEKLMIVSDITSVIQTYLLAQTKYE